MGALTLFFGCEAGLARSGVEPKTASRSEMKCTEEPHQLCIVELVFIQRRAKWVRHLRMNDSHYSMWVAPPDICFVPGNFRE